MITDYFGQKSNLINVPNILRYDIILNNNIVSAKEKLRDVCSCYVLPGDLHGSIKEYVVIFSPTDSPAGPIGPWKRIRHAGPLAEDVGELTDPGKRRRYASVHETVQEAAEGEILLFGE